MKRRSLVTGGAGFLGSHLVDRLIADGDTVTVLDDFSTGRRENLAEVAGSPRLRIVEGSILDRATVELAMRGCERVFHLAVQCVRRSLSRPIENHHINASGTLFVLEQARRQRIARFLYCSSSEVYGNCGGERLAEETTVCAPTTVYGAAKLAGSRFTVLHGALARLERALGQFMLDVHTAEHDYSETVVPLLVNDAAMFGTGQGVA